METPEATGVIVTAEVSPELLEPLVTVVATLGELGATAGDIPVAGPAGSLRATLVTLVANIRRAMSHRHGDGTRLRGALATTEATGATAGEPWATVATIARQWREAVATVEATWATVTGDATRLRAACGDAATVGATAAVVTEGHLEAAVAQEARACQELLVATKVPLSSDLVAIVAQAATGHMQEVAEMVTRGQVAEEVTSHERRVTEASEELRVATKATEEVAVAMVEGTAARERGRRAVVAHEPLGRLVAACHGATRFYCHLRRRLESIEATVATRLGGPGVARRGPGVPEELRAAVTVAQVLWDASGQLAKGHLLGTLQVARGLVATLGVPDATAATAVAQRCQEATAAIPGLLARGQQ